MDNTPRLPSPISPSSVFYPPLHPKTTPPLFRPPSPFGCRPFPFSTSPRSPIARSRRCGLCMPPDPIAVAVPSPSLSTRPDLCLAKLDAISLTSKRLFEQTDPTSTPDLTLA
ncbi:hypothetical protein N656DRAFT_784676 [Canariomyces notabilis]|uniref:Uncharacterized protein n=1 Tax=Canariomyces notabilis TaxID=2074819 RepID=A0AAN6T7D7_9PEZI|nr:hypothetical protein N656DRAFT_784676 [Canariomyces arenarius]